MAYLQVIFFQFSTFFFEFSFLSLHLILVACFAMRETFLKNLLTLLHIELYLLISIGETALSSFHSYSAIFYLLFSLNLRLKYCLIYPKFIFSFALKNG